MLLPVLMYSGGHSNTSPSSELEPSSLPPSRSPDHFPQPRQPFWRWKGLNITSSRTSGKFNPSGMRWRVLADRPTVWPQIARPAGILPECIYQQRQAFCSGACRVKNQSKIGKVRHHALAMIPSLRQVLSVGIDGSLFFSHHLPPPSPLPLVVPSHLLATEASISTQDASKLAFYPQTQLPVSLGPAHNYRRRQQAHPSPQDVSTKARPLVVPPPPWSSPAVSRAPLDLRGMLALKIFNQLKHQRIQGVQTSKSSSLPPSSLQSFLCSKWASSSFKHAASGSPSKAWTSASSIGNQKQQYVDTNLDDFSRADDVH
ncbi:hypothetical protein B0H14DRAFT_2575558 [Mycena olivaceomarginata]|nr:hypothetical protein B0H14DRAFT_2575558 [Mycena olivaceomarginata]